MARETKVGLLVGLAFIICFSIILANRGHRPALDPTLAYRLPLTTQPMSEPTTVSPAESRPVSGGGEVTHPIERTIPTVIPPRLDRPASTTQLSQATSVERPAIQPESNADTVTRPRVPLSSQLVQPGQSQEALQKLLDQLSDKVGVNDSGVLAGQPAGAARRAGDTPASPPVSRSSGRSRAIRHTVVKGDTLSRIATAYYGTASNTVVNAIFEANRSVMPSTEVLSLDDVLILPLIPGFDGPRAGTGGAGSAPASPRRDVAPTRRRGHSEPQPFRWYQIRKSDRYISIAREQLGNASRWREIYELNKDKFPDPGRIRAGVRIKLPLARTGGS